MSETTSRRLERKTRQRAANRTAILEAAKRVAAREGTGALSLRAVAAEAGYAPASVYEYFRNRAEMVLTLAGDELGFIARNLRERAGERAPETGALAVAANVALDVLRQSGALAAAAVTLEDSQITPDVERFFNGRLIGAMTALADAAGRSPLNSRGAQADIVLLAGMVTGLAVLLRAGRLKALGFEERELLERLDARFAASLP